MYSEVFSLQANLLKALAHPQRLEILQLLRDQELPVSDIHTMLDLPQATISQHLMVLREENILISRREGKQIYYKIADQRLLIASDTLRELLIDRHQGTALADTLTLHMKDLVPVVHDPVCHMRVSPKTASYSCDHQNHQYFFCASGCLKKFQTNPEAYV